VNGTVLCVDPGKRSGWCIVVNGDVLDHGAADGSDVKAVDDVVKRAYLSSSSVYPHHLAIEDQQPFRGRSFASTRTLIRRAEIWAVLAERLGADVTRVEVSTWQAYLGLRGKADQRMASLRGLLRSSGYGSAVGAMTDDTCVACGLALWAKGQ
jgi:hypothetical protein